MLRGDKGKSFLNWFIYVHKADVYDPLKETVWVIEYGRPDEIKKECPDVFPTIRLDSSNETFRKVYSKYLEYISNKS